MSYRAILAENLAEKEPKKTKELQDSGTFQEYLDLAEENVRETQREVARSLGGGPMANVYAREIALAQEMEPSLEEQGIPNEFEMMRKDGFPL